MKRKWRLLAAAGCFLALALVLFGEPPEEIDLPSTGFFGRMACSVRDWIFGNGATYALCGRDIEFTFFVHDAETGEPIPGAKISVRDEDSASADHRATRFELVTNEQGRATVLRKNATCEDVIRPLRKTVTLFNGTWCSFDVRAAGYDPLEQRNLHTDRYAHEDKGNSRSEHLQRVEYKIPLARK